jgi:hypothetical protein
MDGLEHDKQKRTEELCEVEISDLGMAETVESSKSSWLKHTVVDWQRISRRQRRGLAGALGVLLTESVWGPDTRQYVRANLQEPGNCLIERSRWPAPVLADSSFSWSPGEGPGEIDLYRLSWLSRSLQEVYPRLPDGSLRITRRLPDPAIKALLVLHDYWSDRLWDLIDSQPIRFERYAIRLAERCS